MSTIYTITNVREDRYRTNAELVCHKVAFTNKHDVFKEIDNLIKSRVHALINACNFKKSDFTVSKVEDIVRLNYKDSCEEYHVTAVTVKDIA